MSVWGTDDLGHEYDYEKSGGDPPVITETTKITVLSGAGISAESGIPTFRGPEGLWSDETVANLATPRGFLANPEKGWRFYNDRRVNMASCEPNPAHKALAQLEKSGHDVVVITQNIDRLHQRAGSERVIELHGSIWSVRCTNPACTSTPFENTDVPLKEIPMICKICGSVLRPNVVFFEEMLDPEIVQEADRRTKQTDLFLVIGTSGIVYPAAGFAQVAKVFGAYVMEFNIEPTPLSAICDKSVLGPCGETLPEALSELAGIGFDF